MAGGRSTAAAGRGRPILLPGRRTRGRDEQAKGRAKTLRRRHARAKAPGTCAHIPSLRRSPAPSSPTLLPAVGPPIPPSFGGSPLLRPVFALSGGLPTALPRSLPSNDRSVGLSYPPSFVASPPEVRPRCSLHTTGERSSSLLERRRRAARASAPSSDDPRVSHLPARRSVDVRVKWGSSVNQQQLRADTFDRASDSPSLV